MAIEIPEYRTVAEAASITRTSQWTIRGWLSQGLLPRHKVRGKTLVRLDQLLAFIRPENPDERITRNVDRARKALAAKKAKAAKSSHSQTRAKATTAPPA